MKFVTRPAAPKQASKLCKRAQAQLGRADLQLIAEPSQTLIAVRKTNSCYRKRIALWEF